MDSMMAGGKGMSPRKAMASGSGGGNFGCCKLPGSEGGQATHITPMTGEGKELSDSARAVSGSVKGSGAYGRQAAPDHGPMHDHFSRAGKV